MKKKKFLVLIRFETLEISFTTYNGDKDPL